jgi:hypothetical protein
MLAHLKDIIVVIFPARRVFLQAGGDVILSQDADAISCPSGEKTIAVAVEGWPSSVLRQESQSASIQT